jgi:L-threonylcarbamoyladenylate synthase
VTEAASSTEVEQAAEVLLAGGLVALPTETVYGLGAWVLDERAVARVFEVKGRPVDHPLIVHVGHAGALDQWAAAVPAAAHRLAAAFWPGPLTVLLPRGPRLPLAVTGGRPAVGLRVPAHPLALGVLAAMDRRRPGDCAIAAPSANRFGRVSPTTAAHVRADLGDAVDLVLDGGPCAVGVESTIVDLTGDHPAVLRLGGIDLEHLTDVLATRPTVETDDAGTGGGARAPGMLTSHYAPRARVVVVDDADEVLPAVHRLVEAGRGVAVLGPGSCDGLDAEAIELEPAGPPEDYARVLYERLRQADRLGAEVIVVVPPPAGGIGDAVRDRLRRAAS